MNNSKIIIGVALAMTLLIASNTNAQKLEYEYLKLIFHWSRGLSLAKPQ